MANQHIVLLTGPPGIGKTTVVRVLAEQLAEQRLAGFYTAEIRVAGERKGFRLETLDGCEVVIAHMGFPHRHRVGKYGVDVAAIDSIAVSALIIDPRVALYLVDEIGKMECLSHRFVAAMRALLDARVPVVATVAEKGTGFITEVKARNDISLLRLTRENRSRLPQHVLRWLSERQRL